MLFGHPPDDPPWYTNRLLLRFAAMGLGIVGAVVWPSVKQLWNQRSDCVALFERGEIEALVGHEVDMPSVYAYDCDYFETCEATYGDPVAFEVDLSAGRGTTTASYGFSGHRGNLTAADPDAVIEPAPEIDPSALVAIAAAADGAHTITVLVERPLDGSIEIRQRVAGEVTPEIRRRFLGSVKAHLPAAEAFFAE